MAGKGLEMPQLLEDRNENFEFQLVEVKMQGSIARIQINRPEVMNALNEKVVGQLKNVMENLNENS